MGCLACDLPVTGAVYTISQRGLLKMFTQDIGDAHLVCWGYLKGNFLAGRNVSLFPLWNYINLS